MCQYPTRHRLPEHHLTMVSCGFAEISVGRILSAEVLPNKQKVFDTARKYYADLMAKRIPVEADAAQPSSP